MTEVQHRPSELVTDDNARELSKAISVPFAGTAQDQHTLETSPVDAYEAFERGEFLVAAAERSESLSGNCRLLHRQKHLILLSAVVNTVISCSYGR